MKTLEELIDLLRAKGVAVFKGTVPVYGAIELALGPPVSESALSAEAPKRADQPKRDDGLTAEEAAIFYQSSEG